MRYTLLVLLCFSSTLAWSQSHDHSHEAAHETGFEFVLNKGQWNDAVFYKASLPGGAVFLESGCLTYSFNHPEDRAQLHDLQQASIAEQDAFTMRGHAWKVHFEGAQTPGFSAEGVQDHYYNYFTGQDQSKWASKVQAFEAISYVGLYEGIDMALYGHDHNLKYDLVIAPGADIDQLNLRYEGLNGISLTNGALSLETTVGTFIESSPIAYQIIAGTRQSVACEYVLNGNILSYAFPEGYDENSALIIDPELLAATLSGTTGSSNFGHSAAFDLAGNIFTGCVAGGSEYPVTAGAFSETYGGGGWDIGISKLTPDGSTLLWATYIGGSESDYPHSMISNSAQELYVYGSTRSANYPTTNSAFQSTFGGNSDIIISHLSTDGATMIGSTYVGGTDSDGQNSNSFNYGDTYRGEIVLDYNELPLVVSCSSSNDFPTTAGAYQTTNAGSQDAVVMRFNPELSIQQFSTFIGGPESDTGYGIRNATDGSIYICGGAADNFPITAGAYQNTYQGPTGGFEFGDGFVAKFNANGTSLLASSYYGTDEPDQAFFIDLDFDENVWIFGQAAGTLPIIGTDVYEDIGAPQFVAKFNQELDDVLIATTVGGAGGGFGGFVPDAFLVDNCSNIYISAYNADGDEPVTGDALFTSGGFYLAVYEEDMADIVFGTFYTGNHVDGGTSRFDKNGVVYQAVCSGGGFSTTLDAYATDQSIGWDIGVFKINFDASGVNSALGANDLTGCAPYDITFQNFSIGDQFIWDFGDGSPNSGEYEPSHTYVDPGVYTVSLIAMDSLSCNLADTTIFDITISTPQDFLPSFTYDIDCANQEVIGTNTTGLDWLEYQWDMGDGTILTEYDVSHQYDGPGDYTISLIAIDNGCNADETITEDITLEPAVIAEIASQGLEACDELTVTFDNGSSNASTYSWDFGDGTNSTETEPEHVFTGPNVFEVILTATNPTSCNVSDTDTVAVTVGANQTLAIDFDIIQTDCQDFIVETDNQSIGNNCAYTWDMGDFSPLLEGENVTHSYAAVGTYDITLTMTDTLCDITETLTQPANVTSEVVAVISNGDEEGCAPFTVDFVNGSAGAATWDFGDGSPTQTGDDVMHTYTDAGTYTVTLSVIGQAGCSGDDVVTSQVVVVAPAVFNPSFTATPTGNCADMVFQFENTSTGDFDDVFWEFGDSNTTQDLDPEHIYALPGSYEVNLTIANTVCDIEAEYSLFLTPTPTLDVEPLDNRICPEIGVATLDALVPNAVYNWSTTEDTQTIEVNAPGTYNVEITIDGCFHSEDIEVTIGPILALDREVTQCQTNSNTLVIPFEGAVSYVWENGVEEQWQDITENGIYPFSLVDTYGCTHAGAFDATIIPYDPPMFIANSFTPNADGINDFFQPVSSDLAEYRIEVFDRWGTKIFESTDSEEHWNGGVQEGEPFYVQDSIYTYKITYRGECSTERIVKQGSVTVLR